MYWLFFKIFSSGKTSYWKKFLPAHLVNFIEKIQAHKISEMWKTWMRILKDFDSIVHFDDVVYYKIVVVLTFLWPYLIKTIRKKSGA